MMTHKKYIHNNNKILPLACSSYPTTSIRMTFQTVLCELKLSKTRRVKRVDDINIMYTESIERVRVRVTE